MRFFIISNTLSRFGLIYCFLLQQEQLFSSLEPQSHSQKQEGEERLTVAPLTRFGTYFRHNF